MEKPLETTSNDKMNTGLLAFLLHFNYKVHHGSLVLE